MASTPALGSSPASRSGRPISRRLQRNIVLSHAAGIGEPMPVPVTRLMMALKLASLARGASGVQQQTIDLLLALLEREITPVIPAQGSVGRLRRPGAPRAPGGGDDRRRRVVRGGARLPAADALARRGASPPVLGPKEGLALLNGTQFSTAHALAGLFEAERLFRPRCSPAPLTTDAAQGSDTPFDPRIHALRGHAGQREVGAALRALLPAARSAPRTSPATTACRIRTACAASRR